MNGREKVAHTTAPEHYIQDIVLGNVWLIKKKGIQIKKWKAPSPPNWRTISSAVKDHLYQTKRLGDKTEF